MKQNVTLTITLIARGVTAIVSVILSARGLWSLRRGHRLIQAESY